MATSLELRRFLKKAPRFLDDKIGYPILPESSIARVTDENPYPYLVMIQECNYETWSPKHPLAPHSTLQSDGAEMIGRVQAPYTSMHPHYVYRVTDRHPTKIHTFEDKLILVNTDDLVRVRWKMRNTDITYDDMSAVQSIFKRSFGMVQPRIWEQGGNLQLNNRYCLQSIHRGRTVGFPIENPAGHPILLELKVNDDVFSVETRGYLQQRPLQRKFQRNCNSFNSSISAYLNERAREIDRNRERELQNYRKSEEPKMHVVRPAMPMFPFGL